jgi:hypothetical protein
MRILTLFLPWLDLQSMARQLAIKEHMGMGFCSHI